MIVIQCKLLQYISNNQIVTILPSYTIRFVYQNNSYIYIYIYITFFIKILSLC